MQNSIKTCCNLCTEFGFPVNCLYGLYWLPTREHCYRLNIAKHSLVYFNDKRKSNLKVKMSNMAFHCFVWALER